MGLVAARRQEVVELPHGVLRRDIAAQGCAVGQVAEGSAHVVGGLTGGRGRGQRPRGWVEGRG